jgi:hypothetical protein
MFTKNNFLMLCCRPTAIHFTFWRENIPNCYN